MARLVKSFGVKCVLSGEGADEAMAGYLYFHKAPSPEALHAETVRKLSRLHHYDVLRANKAMAAAGVEVRVSRGVIHTYLSDVIYRCHF